MKTTLHLYGQDYEIEIKARDKRNLKASKKATKLVLCWLEKRMWESSHRYEDVEEEFNEIRNNAANFNKLRQQ